MVRNPFGERGNQPRPPAEPATPPPVAQAREDDRVDGRVDGRISAPRRAIAPSGPFEVRGEARHPDLPVSQVVVTVDGAVAGCAAVEPDGGWSLFADVDRTAGTTVAIHAYALADAADQAGARRLGPLVRIGGRQVPVDADAPPPAAADPWSARLSAGLRGSIDVPQQAATFGANDVVGGWVLHETLPVRRVLLTLDDTVAGVVDVTGERPDLVAAYPASAGRLTGWTTTVAAPEPWRGAATAGEVTLRAYALVGSPADAHGPGTPVLVAERRLEIVPGALDPVDECSPGVLRVSGTASAPSGLSRVELSTDGATWSPARSSLPLPGGAAGEDTALAGFAGYVPVPPGAGSVTVRAAAVGLDGRRHELRPLEVPVVDPPLDGPSPERLARLAGRFADRMQRLGAGRRDGTPRVLVATHSLGLGGAQLYLSLLVEGLRRRGLELCLVAGQTGPQLADLEAQGIPVLVVGQTPGSREEVEAQVLEIATFATEHGARACLGNSLPVFPAVTAAQRLGLPTTWVLHESFELPVFFHEFLGRALPASIEELARAALRGADEVVFVAEATRELYTRALVDPERARVVPYGVETDAIEAFVRTHEVEDVRRQLGLGAESLVLGCIGTVEARKAQLALLRAFGRLPVERRRGVELVIVGLGDTSYDDAVRRFVAGAGLDGVHLVEATPDIHPWHLACDVLVSASDVESLPRTMLEAMAMARPVASTAVFGVTDLVEDGRTGFLCPPSDLGALTSLLERVVDAGRPRLAEMGAAAREHVATRYDPATYVDHFERRLRAWLAEED